jgi:CRP-like cAMP-binding protein
MNQKLNLEIVINFLLETQMFKGLAVSELSEIASVMDIQKFQAGEVIFNERDIGDSWYVLFDGSIQVSKHIPFQKDKRVAILQKHACFGEMAILDSSPRSASIKAKEKCIVFRFPRRRFERLLEEGKLGAYKLVYGMACTLAKRQRQLNIQIAELTKEIEDIEAEFDQDRSDIFDRTDLFTIER